MITTVLIITVSLEKLSAIFILSVKAFRSYLDQLLFPLHIREWVVYIWGELFHWCSGYGGSVSNIFWWIFLEGILKRKDISMILREAKSQTIILLYTKKHDQR